MPQNKAKKQHFLMIALCLGLLLVLKLKSDYNARYRQQYVEDIKFMGSLLDNETNRRFLLKSFGQALRNNQTANYVAIVWVFTDGTFKRRNIELGYDRQTTSIEVYHYYSIRDKKDRSGCGMTGESEVQRIISLYLNNKQLWPTVESSSIFGSICGPSH